VTARRLPLPFKTATRRLLRFSRIKARRDGNGNDGTGATRTCSESE
jgi:hypothetical protein